MKDKVEELSNLGVKDSLNAIGAGDEGFAEGATSFGDRTIGEVFEVFCPWALVIPCFLKMLKTEITSTFLCSGELKNFS